jgi:serine/threonine protein kinase
VSLESRVLAGRYQLRRHLADGSMGSIWVAQHLTLGVPVAVKLMNVTTARADMHARFEREAKALALLRNPHVIQIIDYGTEDGAPFIVMELLDGADLLTVIDASPPWSAAEVAELVQQVAMGLGAAHEAGLIHRDVKPRNIYLAKSRGGVVAKLVDFGIAKSMTNESEITGTGVVLGSPMYMSPEQIRAYPLDGGVDIWALAVVAFRLLTGAPPFTGDDGLEITSRILAGTRKRIAPPAPKALELERFFERAFAKDRDTRFATAEELANALILVVGAPASLKTAERVLASAERAPAPALRRWSEDDSVTNITPRPASEASDDLEHDIDPDEIEDTQSTNG